MFWLIVYFEKPAISLIFSSTMVDHIKSFVNNINIIIDLYISDINVILLMEKILKIML
jgi:hypothetical protein